MFYYSVKKEYDTYTYQSETPYLTNHRHNKNLYKNTGSQMSFSGSQNTLTTDTTNTLYNNSGMQNILHMDTTNTLSYKNGMQNTLHTDTTNTLSYKNGMQNTLHTDTTNTLSYKNGMQNTLHTDTANTLGNNSSIFNPSLLNYSYVNILHIYQHHKNKQKCFTIVSKKNTTLIKVKHLITQITGTTKNFTKIQVLR